MNAKAPRPQDDAERRRRRAEHMIRALVARLDGATSCDQAGLAAEHPHASGPSTPPGYRSGEGAASVLPYLRQSRRARARPSDERP